jgi:hypothetical protein
LLQLLVVCNGWLNQGRVVAQINLDVDISRSDPIGKRIGERSQLL